MTEEQVVDNVEEIINAKDLKDWQVDKYIFEIKENNEQIKRLEDVYKNRVEELKHNFETKKQTLQKRNYFITSSLGEYAKRQKLTKTKTQSKLSLLSGEIVIKHKAKSITKPLAKNEERLAKLYPEHTTKEEVVKTNWKEIKKNLVVQGNSVYDKNTGEVLDDIVEIVEKEEEIIIK